MYLLGPQIFPAPNEMTEAIGKARFELLEDMISKPTDAVTFFVSESQARNEKKAKAAEER